MNETTDLYNIEKVISYQIFRLNATSLMDYDEAYQIGYLAYLKAKKNWNKSAHDTLTLAYVTPYIYGDLLLELKRIMKVRSINQYYENDDYGVDSDHTLWDTYNATTDDRIPKLQSLLYKLSAKERFIVEEFYFSDKPPTLRELAQKYGVTKQRVHEIKAKALEFLKNEFKRM